MKTRLISILTGLRSSKEDQMKARLLVLLATLAPGHSRRAM
jgi:hypothetical protein